MNITINQLKELNESDYQIIDIRDEIEISHGAIPGAVALRPEEIESSEKADRSKKLVICCSRGKNSVEVAENLREKGYAACSLEGGYAAWLLDYFQAVVGGDQITRSKPDPEIYQTVCRKLGICPEDAYAVEDSYNGVRSASRAGMRTIMVPDLLPPTEEMEKLAYRILPDLCCVKELFVEST